MRAWNRYLAAVGFALLALPGQAQNFPGKSVRIVVPFGAGGVADMTARAVAQKLSQSSTTSPVPAESAPATQWPRPSRTVIPCC